MTLSKQDKAKAKALYSKMVEPAVERHPSHLHIQSAHLPEIKDWQVGKTYDIHLKAKMVSKSEGGWDGKQPLQAEFQVGTEQPDGADSESIAEED